VDMGLGHKVHNIFVKWGRRLDRTNDLTEVTSWPWVWLPTAWTHPEQA
jgi:hypothetical protein